MMEAERIASGVSVVLSDASGVSGASGELAMCPGRACLDTWLLYSRWAHAA